MTEAKAHFSALIDRVEQGEGPFVITRHGKPVAVLSRAIEHRHLDADELIVRLRKNRESQLKVAEFDGMAWEDLKPLARE
ncbi:type II toxin-antitoxin system Phd/YefM family antitoxin [Maricaulis sp.]|uniref:type II toxin-antitoxin system Phd/YefM family antitoxin n=1 Tax=Maricaulis sp. TaxID=1486257 RepID=UPI0025BCCFBB|nr:type II toxin-antitoxin system Phd/YefM family antitoxin [Maricaulis sp.]